MILSFSSGSDILLVSVGKNRELSIASEVSRYVFVRVEDLDKLKSFSSEEKVALLETKKIVSSLSSLVEVKDYVVVEMGKLGFVFSRELSLNEYNKVVGVEVGDIY